MIMSLFIISNRRDDRQEVATGSLYNTPLEDSLIE